MAAASPLRRPFSAPNGPPLSRRIPGFVVSAAISLIRSSVLKKTGMDILALRPIADVGRSFVPVCVRSSDGGCPTPSA